MENVVRYIENRNIRIDGIIHSQEQNKLFKRKKWKTE